MSKEEKEEDIKTDEKKDDRSPCEREGHNYQTIDSEKRLYCTKCGEFLHIPEIPGSSSNTVIGFSHVLAASTHKKVI